MEEPAPTGASRLTPRLRLVPAGPAGTADLLAVHHDDEVWPWYHEEKPGLEQAERWATSMADSWRLHGVHKWIAYDRGTGGVVGRGGLSRTPVDDDWGQIYRFLPAEPWVRVAYGERRPFVAHAHWLEIGWALRRGYWGRGYASEIGRAGLAYAFDVLGARAVVSCTVRHNVRSRAVMERIGMRYAGEIRSRGMVEGVDGERDDAPYAVCVLLRRDWAPSPTKLVVVSRQPRPDTPGPRAGRPGAPSPIRRRRGQFMPWWKDVKWRGPQPSRNSSWPTGSEPRCGYRYCTCKPSTLAE